MWRSLPFYKSASCLIQQHHSGSCKNMTYTLKANTEQVDVLLIHGRGVGNEIIFASGNWDVTCGEFARGSKIGVARFDQD